MDFTDFSDAKKRDIFLDELKNLSAYDLPDATASLSELFRALNYDRCSKDLDTPGYVRSFARTLKVAISLTVFVGYNQGRYLIKSEPTLIFWITDGQQCLSVDQDNQIISPSVKVCLFPIYTPNLHVTDAFHAFSLAFATTLWAPASTNYLGAGTNASSR